MEANILLPVSDVHIIPAESACFLRTGYLHLGLEVVGPSVSLAYPPKERLMSNLQCSSRETFEALF